MSVFDAGVFDSHVFDTDEPSVSIASISARLNRLRKRDEDDLILFIQTFLKSVKEGV